MPFRRDFSSVYHTYLILVIAFVLVVSFLWLSLVTGNGSGELGAAVAVDLGRACAAGRGASTAADGGSEEGEGRGDKRPGSRPRRRAFVTLPRVSSPGEERLGRSATADEVGSGGGSGRGSGGSGGGSGGSL